MIISRLLSFLFRLGELGTSAVVLGIIAYFLHISNSQNGGPFAREVYVVVLGSISVIVSFVWLIPFTFTFMHYPFDFLMSLGWWAAFGLIVDWTHRIDCRQFFVFRGFTFRLNAQCSKWRAAEAFACVTAVLWLLSALLSIWVFHRVSPRDKHASPRPSSTVRTRSPSRSVTRSISREIVSREGVSRDGATREVV